MSEWLPWSEAAAAASGEARLAAWIEDILRPVIEDGVVDELESRLLDVSWAAYGLSAQDAADHAARLETELAACRREPGGAIALARLDSVRAELTAEEQAAVDAWAARRPPADPPQPPGPGVEALIRSALSGPEAADPAAADPAAADPAAADPPLVASPSAPVSDPTPPRDTAAVGEVPSAGTPDAPAPAPTTLTAPPDATTAPAAAPHPVVPTAPPDAPAAARTVPSTVALKLVGPDGAPPFVARVRTAVNGGMVRPQGPDARFYDPSCQFTVAPSPVGWQIEPNPSATNETLLNGRALREARPLAPGDVIGVGREAKNIVKLPLTVGS